MEENQKHTVSLGTVYDINKQIMLNQNSLSKHDLIIKRKELQEWFNWHIDCYAALLCRELYDFTVFHLYENQNPNPPAVAAKELIEVLKERGKILSIEKTEDNQLVWEIWIKKQINSEKEECFVYYLFCYDDFVIEC